MEARAAQGTSTSGTRRLAWGAVLGLVAAVVGIAAWLVLVAAIGRQVSLPAVGVGLLVGGGVILGSRGARGWQAQTLSVTLTLLAMVCAEYLIFRQQAVIELAQEGITNVPLLLPAHDSLALVGESLQAYPLTIAFWAFALYYAHRVSAPRPVRARG
ncbi:MAG TPA: hypothetical protein VML96_04755 [Egibacteraceae bacterium]|nr:hypothetical protein [Egibacteraceae bacterium]